jgi:uncharacterized protein (TIGR03118 family)
MLKTLGFFVRIFTLASLVLCLAFSFLAFPALAGGYVQDNLVSDGFVPATVTDSNFVNPWGISHTATSPFWVSNNGTGRATLYNGAGTPLPLVVTIPNGSPTGVVYNGTGSFNNDTFIFASQNGEILGWRGALGTSAEILFSNSGTAAYTGLALGTISTDIYLYAANFSSGAIDVFPASGAPSLPGGFTDPNLPSGYAPFNVQYLGGKLFVTYAAQSGPGSGQGFVDTFDLSGNFLARLIPQGSLDSPWGLALAPATFGEFGGTLLVGDNGNGLINAFNPLNGAFLGTLQDGLGNPIVNAGLWSLIFGNGGNGGDVNTLYFTAGLEGELHGLFGSLDPVPVPSTLMLLGSGLAGLVGWRRFRKG